MEQIRVEKAVGVLQSMNPGNRGEAYDALKNHDIAVKGFEFNEIVDLYNERNNIILEKSPKTIEREERAKAMRMAHNMDAETAKSHLQEFKNDPKLEPTKLTWAIWQLRKEDKWAKEIDISEFESAFKAYKSKGKEFEKKEIEQIDTCVKTLISNKAKVKDTGQIIKIINAKIEDKEIQGQIIRNKPFYNKVKEAFEAETDTTLPQSKKRLAINKIRAEVHTWTLKEVVEHDAKLLAKNPKAQPDQYIWIAHDMGKQGKWDGVNKKNLKTLENYAEVMNEKRREQYQNRGRSPAMQM